MEYQLFSLVPSEVVKELLALAKDLKRIIPEMEKNKSSNPLTDWITEQEAQKILGRKTTWFYNKRKSGELEGKKRAGKWWYRMSDIKDFIER